MELLQLTQNAMTVLKNVTFKKTRRGMRWKHPKRLFRRVARNVCSADRSYHPEIDLAPLRTDSTL